MQIDWQVVGSWIGGLGGLTGLASLAWTRWDRWHDRRHAADARLMVRTTHGVARTLELKISYRVDDRREGLQATVRVRRPKDVWLLKEIHADGPPYNPTFRARVEDARREITRTMHMDHRSSSGTSGAIGSTKVFLAKFSGGSTSENIDSGTVTIRVTTMSSRRRLIEKTIHVSPTA